MPGHEFLGKKFKDKVTGFEGLAVAHIAYTFGSDQVQLVPQASEPGKYPECPWFDVARLDVVEG